MYTRGANCVPNKKLKNLLFRELGLFDMLIHFTKGITQRVCSNKVISMSTVERYKLDNTYHAAGVSRRQVQENFQNFQKNEKKSVMW